MKKLFLLAACFCSLSSFTQIPKQYYYLIGKADSLIRLKEYKNAAIIYSMAFRENRDLGFPNDRYNAACSWALSGQSDSAFINLNRIANAGKYDNLKKLINDSAFINLHKYEEWKFIVQKIMNNKGNNIPIFYEAIADTLKEVLDKDQKYRNQIQSIISTYGDNSKELREVNFIINTIDSSNLLIVSNILDRFGWLGISDVGEVANTSLFLVIQHSNLSIQKKYLPIIKLAKRNGKASPEQLALLEDRIAIAEGKKQIYGSQIGYNQQTKKYYVLPLLDSENVDKRRKALGLETMVNYTMKWGIIWASPNTKKIE